MARPEALITCLLALLLASPLLAGWRGFKSAHLMGDEYSVSYTPKTITGKVPNLMLLLIGNTGQLCLDEGFVHAEMSDVDVGDKYQGIKQVTATVEFFDEPTEESDPCEEMAKKPKKPKEVDAYLREQERNRERKNPDA